MPRRRLDQVDAMRPIKQAGVISTHSVIYFAPAAASVASNAALLLLHASREGFFFLLPRAHYATWTAALGHLGYMIETGYYQLYFLLVILQFYLAFPLVLMLLRRTRGHHGLVIGVAALLQVLLTIGMHWGLLPPLMLRWEQQDALSYLLYLIAGGVVAFHLEQADAWVRRHARLVMAYTVVTALGAEAIYFLAQHGVTTVLGSGSDPFQPSVIPFNVGVITCGYLAGVALVRPGRSRRTQALVRIGSDNSYGIYLAQMLFLVYMTEHGWTRLDTVLPWPLVCLLVVGVVFACCITLTALLARTPLAVPLTGRKQQPWPTRLPRRQPPATAESADLDPPVPPDPDPEPEPEPQPRPPAELAA